MANHGEQVEDSSGESSTDLATDSSHGSHQYGASVAPATPATAATSAPMGIPPPPAILAPPTAPANQHAWLYDDNWQRPARPIITNKRTTPYYIEGFPDCTATIPANLTHDQAMNQFPNHISGSYLLWLSRRYTMNYMVRAIGYGSVGFPNGEPSSTEHSPRG